MDTDRTRRWDIAFVWHGSMARNHSIVPGCGFIEFDEETRAAFSSLMLKKRPLMNKKAPCHLLAKGCAVSRKSGCSQKEDKASASDQKHLRSSTWHLNDYLIKLRIEMCGWMVQIHQ